MARGQHVTLDAIIACTRWPDEKQIPDMLETAAKQGGATPLQSRVIILPCEVSGSDSPNGGIAWCGLVESHITLHWFKSKGLVEFALDVFTCGTKSDPDSIITILERMLGADTPVKSRRKSHERLGFKGILK